MLFNFSQVLSSLAKMLSSGLTLHIHLTVIAPFLSSLAKSSYLTDQVSLPYSITMGTCAHLFPEVKLILVNKGFKSLNFLLHSHLILIIILLTAPAKITNFFHNLKRPTT